MEAITLDELKSRKQWVCWQLENINGRLAKIPKNPSIRANAKSNDSTTWSTYDDALRAKNEYGYDGIGIMFSNGLIGIDIDAVGHGTTNATENPVAHEVLDLFSDTYIEKSPSGLGYHILGLCDNTQLPTITDSGKVKLSNDYTMKNSDLELEIYPSGLTNKFFYDITKTTKIGGLIFMKKIILFTTLILLVVMTLVGCTFKNSKTTSSRATELLTESTSQDTTIGTTESASSITSNTETNKTTTSSATETTTNTTTSTTNSTSTNTETTSVTEEVTSAITEPLAVVDNTPHDPTNHKLGSYVNLIYDEYYCDVTYSVQKGIGTSEKVSISVSMKNGYYFSGLYKDNFNEENLIDNGADFCVIKSNREVNIYINYSIKVIYNNVGGNGTYVDYYPIAYYKCPVALNAGMFEISDYVLSEYRTEDGYLVSPGSRFPANKSPYNVYCVWEKVTPSNEFVTEGTVLKKYVGNSENVVIPERVNNIPINTIASDAFDKEGVKRVFIPKTVNKIEDWAFTAGSITEIVMHDSITKMSNNGFDCVNLKSIRINSVNEFYKESSEDGDVFATNNKYDRLIWAKDYKKIVIYGASGSLYGWDCEKLNEAFGDEYVIINLGMNANMNASIVFEGITPFLNEDDILLWACEPGNKVLGDTRFDYLQTWWYTGAYLDLYKNIDISNYQNLFECLAEYNKQKTRNHTSYKFADVTRENIYGDNIKERPNNYYACGQYRFDYFTGFDYSYMSSLIDKLNAKGVKVLFTYATYVEDEVDDSELEFYKEKLLENFDITIISDYKKCRYPITYFWNSEWHLTNEGSTLRTLQVIEDLKNYFNEVN